MTGSILFVDDEQDFLDSVQRGLFGLGFRNLRLESDPRKAAEAIEQGALFDVALLDITMPHISGIELLELIKKTCPDTECIMVTALDNAKVALDCVRKGAYDYLTKPITSEDLGSAVRRAMEKKKLLDIITVAKAVTPPELVNKEAFAPILTRSQKMLRFLKEAELQAGRDAPVLIVGESGTEKEKIARALHLASRRARHPFVTVDAALMKRELMDSDMFGAVRPEGEGHAETEGHVDRAAKGTLFVNEAASLSPALQEKLGRLLQVGEYIRPGAARTRKMDLRLFLGAGDDFDRLLAKGAFRKDLYHMFKGARLNIPPLRERKEDIPLLVEHFLEESKADPKPVIEGDAMSFLIDYDYAGNEAELQSILLAAVNAAKGGPVTMSCLPDYLKQKKRIKFSDTHEVPRALLKNLKPDYLLREMWCPVEARDGTVSVVVDDPNNLLKRDEIKQVLNAKSVEYFAALQEDIVKFINASFRSQGQDSSISEIINRLDDRVEEVKKSHEEEFTVSETDSVVMQLVNKVINDAYVQRASDIHVEPSYRDRKVEIRFRIDGECVPYQVLPYSFRSAVVSRIKIMSNLDITERRMPQDGKIKFRKADGDEIELRVATLPTQGALEDVTMRILSNGTLMPLEEMQLSERNYGSLTGILGKPYGILLCVGPTGSGKTTTLHAAISHVNRTGVKILTVEDPVEITQRGIRQVQVNRKIGLDFAAAMRAFLRSDPDIIMVGEMRDIETARIAIEASLTGHLVLSTLHTNNAPETVVRLLDMGLDPLNFGDSLLGVLAQRLVKALCVKCREEYRPGAEEIRRISELCGRDLSEKMNLTARAHSLYRAAGCPECNGTGYRGRLAIHELLVATDDLKGLIQERAAAEAIRKKAVSQGMTTLLQDGMTKALLGHTDFDQVRKTCIK